MGASRSATQRIGRYLVRDVTGDTCCGRPASHTQRSWNELWTSN